VFILFPHNVRKFEEGSPQERITMLKDLGEVWTQNCLTGGTDMTSMARALVRGESAAAFEVALQHVRITKEGEPSPTSLDNVHKALKAVTDTVFAHCALETQ
jgi:hypothetical protein